MPTIRIETLICAPGERCFDLARDIDFHTQSTADTQERAVAGVTSGLIGLGQSVTWEAVHLGVRQRLTSKIVEFERPHRFVDEMQQGAFQSMRHVHEFAETADGALMTDTLTFVSPFGFLGKLADRLFLERYMRRFLQQRCQALKWEAERPSGVDSRV